MAGNYLLRLTAILAITFSATNASARPTLYSDAFDYGGSVFTCLKGAKKALEVNGFTANIEKKIQDTKVGFITGELPSEYVVAEITCNQKLGVTVMAVSGLDPELTYKKYLQLYDAEW